MRPAHQSFVPSAVPCASSSIRHAGVGVSVPSAASERYARQQLRCKIDTSGLQEQRSAGAADISCHMSMAIIFLHSHGPPDGRRLLGSECVPVCPHNRPTTLTLAWSLLPSAWLTSDGALRERVAVAGGKKDVRSYLLCAKRVVPALCVYTVHNVVRAMS